MKYIEFLDKKAKCSKCFLDGALVDPRESTIATEQPLCTLNWSPQIDDFSNVEIASAYGKDLDLESSEEFVEAQKLIKSHIRAIRNAKISKEVCYGDLIPFRIYRQFCSAKANVVKDFLSNLERPKSYDHLLKIEKLICEISMKKILLDSNNITSTKQSHIIKNQQDRVLYDSKKVVTGRLATRKMSFPIMTLSKKDRAFIKPTNEMFIELDFNSAELRTLLALNDHEQPEEDLHLWNIKNVFNGEAMTRQESKEKLFSWLYDNNKKNEKLSAYYDRDVYRNFYNAGHVKTPFFREIRVVEKKALNYLLQSTSSDVTLEQAYKVRSILKNRKSFIKFLMHDSVIIDVSKEDLSLMKEVYGAFRDTRFGKYIVNVRHGKDFSKMEELSWKM